MPLARHGRQVEGKLNEGSKERPPPGFPASLQIGSSLPDVYFYNTSKVYTGYFRGATEKFSRVQFVAGYICSYPDIITLSVVVLHSGRGFFPLGLGFFYPWLQQPCFRSFRDEIISFRGDQVQLLPDVIKLPGQ